MEAIIWTLLFIHAPQYGIDPKLAAAVIHTESTFNPRATGKLGEVGLFQIRPEFSNYSIAQLYDAETNIVAGLELMKNYKLKCKHKKYNTFVLCHSVGIAGSYHIRKPLEFAYYRKIKERYDRY